MVAEVHLDLTQLYVHIRVTVARVLLDILEVSVTFI